MSTYTDLHNRVKENITVDYNDRITPQEVHLLNENNEYWGTLKGHISAENIDINGGTLKNVKLENIELCGSVVLPGDIDISKITKNISELSTNLQSVKSDNDEKHIKYDNDIDDINDDISKQYEDIKSLSNSLKDIDNRKLDIDAAQQTISNISSIITDQIEILSDDMFNEMTDISTNITKQIELLSDEVFEEISSVSTLTFKEISNVSVALNSTDLQLSDEIITLARNFGEEVQDRVSVDNIIKKSIEEKTAESIERDNAISNELNAYKLENENNIDQLTKDIVEKIEHDKHYTITHDIKGSALTDNYPFSCKDFAVNVYKTNVKDGIVEYTDPVGNTYSIGEIAKISNGYRFKTFDNIGSDAIISSINVGWTYDFVNGVMTVPAGKVNGYYSITLDIDNQTMQLKPIAPDYNAVLNGTKQIGKIYDSEKNGENIISGRIFIDTDDTGLTIFNKFQDIAFNTTDLSSVSIESERIRYFGNNEFEFIKNLSYTKYVPVNDKTTSIEFARIYDTHNNEDLTGTINISLTYLEPEEIIASLNESNAYTSIVKENQITTDKIYNLVVSADIEDNKASFDVVEVSELYKYSFYGTNNDGETIEAGYVVPVQYNKTLKESKAADQISVNIENAINIDAFKKTYVLNKVDDSIWTCEDVSDENTLNIKFNGEEVRLKITSTNGNVVAYIFAINTNDVVIFNTDNCHNHIYVSDKTQLKYSEMEASGGEKYYPININPISINDDIAQYDLNINTSENDILKICVPERSTTDISREFSIIINPKSLNNKLVELQLTDKYGNKVDYISNRRTKLLVPTNMWTTFQVNEINHNKFFIKDFDGNENSHDIRVLSVSIEKLSTDLSTDIISLSTSLSTSLSNEIIERVASYEYLSSQISSNDNDIADIYNRIKGGINYKGTIVAEIKSTDSTGEEYKDITSISALFFREGTTPESIYNDANTILSNGFMYIVNAIDSNAKKKFTIEGRDIDVGDQLIINCKGIDGKAIKDLTIADIDIIDNEDFDTIHLPEFENLSAKLSSEIDSLSISLSNTIKLSVEELQDQIVNNNDDIKHLSDEISANDIDIKHLSDEISANDIDIKYLSDEISANDIDIAYLSAQHNQLSTNLSGDINALSDKLSIEISSVNSFTTLSIGNLCSEISSNDKDILDISVDLISVSNRYSNTFVGKDKSEYTDHISSDNLVLTDIAHPHDKYYMSFESGTIVLKPLK